MRKLLSGMAFIALAVGPALAADLPRKAPAYTPPPPPPPLTWNGWYIGLNAGAGWNNNDFNNTVVSTFCNPILGGCIGPPVATDALRGGFTGFGTGNKAGFIGGGQIGWNYQTGALVWGIETDFQGADINRAGAFTNTVGVVGFPNTITTAGAANQKLNFLGTLRGRLGWTPSPPWLLYLTGGLAYGHIETDAAFSVHISGTCGTAPPFCPDASSFVSKDDWRAGWTVGGGVEWMFAPRWSLKAEYLYYDLGHVTLNSDINIFAAQAVGPSPLRFIGAGIASEASNKGSIARAGVNYHFGAY